MKRFFKFTFGFFLVIIFAGACIGAYFWYMWSSNLPFIGSLKEYRPSIITEVFSEDGKVIGRFWEEKRIVVPLDELPPHLIQAFVAAEDARFYEHEGVDILGIIRAFYKNLTAGKIEQGGSTITQQVTRSLLLKNTERTYRRKAREALLSMQIEKNFSKERMDSFSLSEPNLFGQRGLWRRSSCAHLFQQARERFGSCRSCYSGRAPPGTYPILACAAL